MVAAADWVLSVTEFAVRVTAELDGIFGGAV